MKIAIVGKGNVGSALADAAAWSDAVILAVPWTEHRAIAAAAGRTLDGKTVVDVSNVLTPARELAVGFTTSGAEELQKLMPKARIVKAFNTVFAQNMRTGTLQGERLSVFIAGNDAAGRETVRKIAEDIGFDSIDAGSLRSARYLEPLGMLNITLGYGLGMGTDIGFALIRKPGAAVRKAA